MFGDVFFSTLSIFHSPWSVIISSWLPELFFLPLDTGSSPQDSYFRGSLMLLKNSTGHCLRHSVEFSALHGLDLANEKGPPMSPLPQWTPDCQAFPIIDLSPYIDLSIPLL